ncbi:MAG TPA: hypothetical protein VG753_02105, partial [Candidatus Paceibacterota bacterium]|nr:hypothetical protein [Candidatus Paceibacterota bacterium]
SQGQVVAGTCGGGGGSAFPFTPGSAFGTTVNATGTVLQLQGGLFASSTVRFGNAGVDSQFLYNGTTGFMGLGTSSPWAQFSINPTAANAAAPSFAIGSTTGTDFVVTNSGHVGIGTSTPYARFAIQAITGVAEQLVDVATAAGASIFHITSSGLVGIGTSTPTSKLSVVDPVSTAQQTIAYDGTHYAQFLVDATGNLTITPSGNKITIPDDNLFVCQGSACPTSTATSTSGNLFVENAVTIGDGFSVREIGTGDPTYGDQLGLYDTSGALMVIFDDGQ